MKHKTISKNTIWIFAAVIVAGFLTLAFATYGPRSQPQVISIYKDLIRSRSENGLYAEPGQKAINSSDKHSEGILEAISFGNSKIEAIICLDLPDKESWIPEATLKIKDEVIEWSDFALINSKDPATYTSTNRCFLIGFPYTKTDNKKINVKLSVNLFKDESADLTNPDIAKKIKAKLNVKHPELDFEIVTESGNGGGGAYIVIKAKPSNMSEDEALRLIDNATIEKGNGKWVFDTDVP